MHLVATRDVDFIDLRPRFRSREGSSIHTENSHKYGPRGGARAVARRRLDPGRGMDRPARRFRR